MIHIPGSQFVEVEDDGDDEPTGSPANGPQLRMPTREERRGGKPKQRGKSPQSPPSGKSGSQSPSRGGHKEGKQRGASPPSGGSHSPSGANHGQRLSVEKGNKRKDGHKSPSPGRASNSSARRERRRSSENSTGVRCASDASNADARQRRRSSGASSADSRESTRGLPRIQTGLSPSGPVLPPDYQEEEVVRDWGEPMDDLPVPAVDHLTAGTSPNTHVEVAHDPYNTTGQMVFVVPNNRQMAIERARWEFRDPKVRVFMADYEDDLTESTIHFLEDSTINPYCGSVPVERIQNVVRTKVPDLYSKVVGTRHGSWKKYVEKHEEVFQLFSVEEGKWRMRLLKHTDYKIGDEREIAARVAWEKHFTQTLLSYLQSVPEQKCRVDDFMQKYPELPCNQRKADGSLEFPLPPRGDLVRFVKRHPQYFGYDPTIFLISMKSQ